MPQHLLSPVTIPSLPCIFLRFIFASRHVPLKNLHASTQRISRCGFPSASQAKKNTNLTKMSALKAWTLVPRAKNQDAWRRLGALMSLSASQFEILKPTWLCGSDQEQIFGCFRLPHQLIWPACPSYPVRRPPAQDWRTVSPCFHFPLFPPLPLSLRVFFLCWCSRLAGFHTHFIHFWIGWTELHWTWCHHSVWIVFCRSGHIRRVPSSRQTESIYHHLYYHVIKAMFTSNRSGASHLTHCRQVCIP